jgi:hypothetical protein
MKVVLLLEQDHHQIVVVMEEMGVLPLLTRQSSFPNTIFTQTTSSMGENQACLWLELCVHQLHQFKEIIGLQSRLSLNHQRVYFLLH